MDTSYEEKVFLVFENFEAEVKASFNVGFGYNPGGFDEPPEYYLENCKLEDFEVIGYTKEGDFLELTKEQVNQVDEKLKEYVEVHEDEIFANALEQM